MSGDPIIRFDHVGKSYGVNDVLTDVRSRSRAASSSP